MDFEDFILFDAFKKINKFYLNLSVFNTPVDIKDIEVCINCKILDIDKTIINANKQCSTAIYIYNCDDLESNLIYSVEYKNKKYRNTFEDVSSNKHYKLTLTTLFKDDYNYFPLFYNYYKNQGVEKFYMYYNGIPNKKIINILNKNDVALINWDFPYRYKNTKIFKTEKKGKLPKWTTVAQIGQMHNALYKYGKDNSEYMIFCDIDEYLYIENDSIKSFIFKNNKDLYGFNNIWAKTIESHENLNILPNNILISNQKFKYGNRSKNIYKTSKVNTIGIHKMFEETKYLSKLTNLNLFHFYNWTNNPSRKNHIIECINPLKIQFY